MGNLLKMLMICLYVCRYAFPDLTNEQGYWAKAVPEAIAQRGIVLFFFINVGSTEVRYGFNDAEVGVFFSGVQTSSPLWALLDLYGSTVSVEFVGTYLNTKSLCRLYHCRCVCFPTVNIRFVWCTVTATILDMIVYCSEKSLQGLTAPTHVWAAGGE